MSKARRPSKGSTQASGPKTAREQETTTKRRGELAELAFVLKAASLGFGVAKPYGDSERYDFIVDSGQTLSRVQVKSSSTLLNGLYRINAHRRTAHGVVPYDPSEVDFMAAYVIPDDAWFIIPIAITTTRTSLLLCPYDWPRGDGLYGAYREAWHLMREPDGLTF